MSEKVIQCCYSNVISETGTGGGWQVTACSEGIPAQIREEYARIQDSNVTSQEPKGADGNPLNLYEIVIQKGYLMLTRVAYGLKDRGGRHNNMLSHSYLFPVDQALLADPNVFLTVEDGNFTDDIQRAKQIPQELKRGEPYTLKSAMALCGLNRESYVQLIYAMYVQRESKRSLYIHSSKGEAVIRPFLYCIWKGLPLAYRRTLSVSSAVVNPNSVRTLIFSSDHGMDELFYDLDTGENNVLDPRSMKKYRRWGFVDYFAEHYDSMDGEEYFARLEETALKLGDGKAAKPKILKIAHQILCGGREELPAGELQKNLVEALCAPVERSAYMDTYICSVLQKVNDAGLLLDSEMAEESLMERLNGETVPELKTAAEEYLLRKITAAPAKEGAVMLAQLSGERFERFCSRIQETENGSACLDAYYRGRVPQELSWESLNAFLTEVDAHCDEIYPGTKEALADAAGKLYRRELSSPGSKQDAYLRYTEFGGMIAANGEEEAAFPENARRMYWEQFSMESFSWKNREEYEFFKIPDDAVCECARLLCYILVKMQGGTADGLMGNMQALFQRYGRLLPAGIRRKLYENMIQFLDAHSVSGRELYVNLFYLMMSLGSTDFWKEYQSYAEMIAERDMEGFTDCYELNIREIQPEREREKVIRTYNICLFQYLKRQDLLEQVTIDVVLSVGKSMYGNPFEILENLSLFASRLYDLMEFGAEETVEGSVLLGTEEFMDAAEEYIREDTEYRQIVKEWLSEVRRQQKSEKRRGDGDLKSSLGGWMSKIIPRSDDGDADDEEESEPRRKRGGFFKRR